MVLHGENDPIVPPNHAFELYTAAGEPRLLKILKGGDHEPDHAHTEEVHEQVLNPTYQILDYLETNPSGAELAKNGCALILRKAEEIPDGVDKVREIADSRYSVTHRRCIRSYTSMDYGGRYFSHHGHHGHHGFYGPSPYESCALWQYDTTRDPNYGNVIELSQQMDLMYSQANHLCGEAAQGNLDGAQAEARGLKGLSR